MALLRSILGGSEPPEPDLLQVIDALVLFDTPLLDQRFQEAIAMHPDAASRAALAALPARVAEGSRFTRRAAVEWERVRGGEMLVAEFRRRAERFLLEGFLDAAEAQLRLKTFMSGEAPTVEVRQLIDAAIERHRELVRVLRDALLRLDAPVEATGEHGDAPLMGEEAPHGDLRTQVEQAIRRVQASGKKPRVLALSANAVRHLRDQGMFRNGDATVMGVPIHVEFTWPGASFALLTFDSVSLDEILQEP